MKTEIVTTLIALTLLVSCNQNSRAKKFGGSAQIELPKGTKLVNATWKADELWYLYRPSRSGETPEVIKFKESSSWGLVEGEVVFTEK